MKLEDEYVIIHSCNSNYNKLYKAIGLVCDAIISQK
jgi:hypothetical protein